MATFYSPEEFADAVVLSLLDYLPDALEAQRLRFANADALAGRDVPLPPPREEDYYPGGIVPGARFPAVEVAVPDLTIDGLDIHQLDGPATVMLAVRVHLEAARDPILYRQAYRYGGAVFSALSPRGRIGFATIRRLRAAWRFNPETGLQDSVRTGIALVFECDSSVVRP